MWIFFKCRDECDSVSLKETFTDKQTTVTLMQSL